LKSGTGRIIALDVGFKRIGVAISDPLGVSVRPLTIIHRKDNVSTFSEIEKIIRLNRVKNVVIGIPLSKSGRETAMSEKIRKFGNKLYRFLKEKGLDVNLTFHDEYLTTEEAKQVYKAIGKEKEEMDDVAAAVILRDYLKEVSK